MERYPNRQLSVPASTSSSLSFFGSQVKKHYDKARSKVLLMPQFDSKAKGKKRDEPRYFCATIGEDVEEEDDEEEEEEKEKAGKSCSSDAHLVHCPGRPPYLTDNARQRYLLTRTMPSSHKADFSNSQNKYAESSHIGTLREMRETGWRRVRERQQQLEHQQQNHSDKRCCMSYMSPTQQRWSDAISRFPVTGEPKIIGMNSMFSRRKLAHGDRAKVLEKPLRYRSSRTQKAQPPSPATADDSADSANAAANAQTGSSTSSAATADDDTSVLSHDTDSNGEDSAEGGPGSTPDAKASGSSMTLTRRRLSALVSPMRWTRRRSSVSLVDQPTPSLTKEKSQRFPGKRQMRHSFPGKEANEHPMNRFSDSAFSSIASADEQIWRHSVICGLDYDRSSSILPPNLYDQFDDPIVFWRACRHMSQEGRRSFLNRFCVCGNNNLRSTILLWLRTHDREVAAHCRQEQKNLCGSIGGTTGADWH